MTSVNTINCLPSFLMSLCAIHRLHGSLLFIIHTIYHFSTISTIYALPSSIQFITVSSAPARPPSLLTPFPAGLPSGSVFVFAGASGSPFAPFFPFSLRRLAKHSLEEVVHLAPDRQLLSLTYDTHCWIKCVAPVQYLSLNFLEMLPSCQPQPFQFYLFIFLSLSLTLSLHHFCF